MTTDEEQLLHSRCAMDGQATQDSAVICKKHGNEWLQRYKPTKCAACPQPLSSSGSMPCPDWLREKLGAHHGAFVHKRPCYEKALAAKKQQAADTQPMEVEQENNPHQPTFHIDVSQHRNMHKSISCTCNILTTTLSVSVFL